MNEKPCASFLLPVTSIHCHPKKPNCPIKLGNGEEAERCSCVYCTSSSSSITERKRFHVQIHFSSQKFSCACILTKQSL